MSYKVKVNSEAESKEVQEYLKSSGYHHPYGGFNVKNGWICVDGDVHILPVCQSQAGSEVDEYKAISFDQLRDLVVLKRNDVSDKNVKDGTIHDLYQTSNGTVFFYHHFKMKWIESEINKSANYMADVKPIQKETKVKEYLVKNQNDEYVLLNDVSRIPSEFVIEVPEGAMFATGSEVVFRKNNYILVGGDWKITDATVGNAKELGLNIIWQRETLNDKVASAEVVRQEVTADLPEFNFEAVDDFVESNIEQTLSDRESTYGSFKNVAATTRNLMNCIDVDSMNAVQQEALHMICSKLARIANGDPNHVDSWHDIAGYATLVVKDINENSSKD